MSISRLRFRGTKWVPPLSSVCSKRLSSAVVSVSEPHYPPIVEQGPLAEKLRRKEEWHKWLKSHDTVEEKLYELNMPKYYGWEAVRLNERTVPYNFLPWAQFATRTHIEVNETIKPIYSDASLDDEASELATQLKSQVEEVILFEYHHLRRRHELSVTSCKDLTKLEIQDIFTKSFVNHLSRVLITGVVPKAKHLNAATIVPEPRLEAFWFLGGINPSQKKLEERKLRTKMTNLCVRKSYLDPSLVDGPVNEPIQFCGEPILQLQSRYPLPSAEDLLEEDPRAKGIPHVPYEPKNLYLEKKFRHATTIPGFWPGEPHEFGIMSFLSSNFLESRPFGLEENLEGAHSVAILSSFSWLLGQACYQGFSTFHDVTYPLLTQTALTNGKDWSFYLYQLNTTLLHTKNSTENPRCNLCWAAKPVSLFESVHDGRVIGLNEDVLKQIVKMYLLEPRERHGVEMKPYLSDKPHIADIDFEERRVWLEGHYKYLTSNRPRVQEKPEMYAWEYIYKVKFNDMPAEKKTQWFVTQQPPPDARRLDDHPKIYKPKALRTEAENKLDKSLKRFERTFYPGTNKNPIVGTGK